ncbi:hypothetical protein [Burkholderia plantarii]|uniref:hypothetical protein n=1 Tax=Burkholderia plantarii TaxID=41899 RepID=UPI0018DB8C4A|nr:hypothetical protein [Burkholderia plantarii]MBI0325557.1 hypothetical protein [Burkholderia plantarii]
MAGGNFSIRVDTALFDSQVEDHVRRQLPFAASVALNKTANVAKQALVAEMRDVFDRPTPYVFTRTGVAFGEAEYDAYGGLEATFVVLDVSGY